MDFVRKGVKSKDSTSKYKKEMRVHSLSAEQVIASKKIAEDLVVSLQHQADRMMSTDLVLRKLFALDYIEEQGEVQKLILADVKFIIKKMSSI